jgi:hypothetical protein
MARTVTARRLLVWLPAPPLVLHPTSEAWKIAAVDPR